MALRKDVISLITYLRDNKVTGTQSTGNLTCKAVEEIAARSSIHLRWKMSSETNNSVSAARKKFGLYILYTSWQCWRACSAEGPAGGGDLQRLAKGFLTLPVTIQVWLLFRFWWFEANWLIAFPFQWMGESLLEGFRGKVQALLLEHHPNSAIRFELFSDHLIEAAGWEWPIADQEHTRIILRSAVERMVIQPLTDFGAVIPQYGPTPIGDHEITSLVSFQLTPFGVGLLNMVAEFPGA